MSDVVADLERAARALGRIDRDGPRAIASASFADVEAMAVALTLLGLVPVQPGADAPAELVVNKEERVL